MKRYLALSLSDSVNIKNIIISKKMNGKNNNSLLSPASWGMARDETQQKPVGNELGEQNCK
jgi:hypothetical protein